MILLATVESVPHGVLSPLTSIATMWLNQVITYVIHSHYFNIKRSSHLTYIVQIS